MAYVRVNLYCRKCTFVHIFCLGEANCGNISKDYSSQLLYAVHYFHAVYTYKTIFNCRHLVISCAIVYLTQAILDVMLCNVMLCYFIELAFSFFMEDTVTLCTVISNQRDLSRFFCISNSANA
jgi:hypothetical protein